MNEEKDPEVVENVAAVEAEVEVETEVEETPEFIDSKAQADGEGETSESEEADTSTESDSNDDDNTEDSTATPKKGVQKRIDKLTAKARSAEREAEYWKSLAQEKAEKPPEPQIPAMPDLNLSLENPEKYQEAMAKYNADLHEYNKGVAKYVNSEATFEAQTQQAEALSKELDQEWSSNVESFKESAPDFDKLVQREDNPLSQPMFEIAKRSELGPEVLYELAKNPAEAMRIYGMNPIQTAHEMGKIEARLSVKPKTKSSAPSPLSNVRAGGETAHKNMSDLPMEDYAKAFWAKSQAQQN